MHLEPRLVANCIALLEHGVRLLERIDDDLFAKTGVLSPRGSVGEHFRHCLDFYESFLSGLDEGRIDYNVRNRERRVEIDRAYAIDQIQRLKARLWEVSSEFRIAPILVSTEEGGAWCGSSLVRELEFLQSHTIHHYALIAMLLRFEGIDPGDEFGVAPSTLRYWQESAVTQPGSQSLTTQQRPRASTKSAEAAPKFVQ